MSKNLLIIIFSATAIICCSSAEKSEPTIGLERMLPEMLGGYTRVQEAGIYPADSLWNYIDGAADEYLSYSVVQVATVEYVRNKSIYSVDIFEFADRLGAFGIYAKRRLPTDNFISLGTEALLGNGYLYYLKDKFFITINSYSDILPDLERLGKFAAAIDSIIPGTADYPKQILAFPQKRLVAHSEKFWPSGLDFFAAPESCFSADYIKNESVCTLFYSSERTVTEYETLVTVIQKKGRILSFTAGVGKNSVYAITEQTGKTLMGYTDGIIFGVLNVAGDLWARTLCEALMENLGVEL